MKRRNFIASLGAASIGMATSKPAPAAKPKEKTMRPNILFIMTDQQHSGMMSCAGNKNLNTPALDSLARQGVRFERAYAANPVCVPSRIAMAGGVMPGRMGMFANHDRAKVPEEVAENSLGLMIERAGYDTFYGGKTHLCPEMDPRKAGYNTLEKDSREKLPDACIEFIKKKRDKPFYAVASFINPHDICFAYNAYLGKNEKNKADVADLYRKASALPTDRLPPLPENYAIPENEPEAIESSCSPKAVTPAVTMRQKYNEREWRIYRWIYCRLTEQVDGHIGRILEALKEAGVEERTLILFVSDHGNMDASHRLASKSFFYEESAHVPFLMQYKGVIPPGRVEDKRLVSTGLDILPTLCDYAGIEPPKSLLGASLRRAAEGLPDSPRRPYVAVETAAGRMIRSDKFKYCVYRSGSIRESLVDLQNDPGEMQNLASLPEHKDALLAHRRYLDEWIAESGDKTAAAFAIGAVRR